MGGVDSEAKFKLQWDFLLTRDDGSVVLLHPNLTVNTISCKFSVPPSDHEIPRSGLGGTSGRGTFKYFANKYVEKQLKWKKGAITWAQTLPQSLPELAEVAASDAEVAASENDEDQSRGNQARAN